LPLAGLAGKDGVVRGAVVKTGKGTLERAVQHLFPLELSCDLNSNPQLNPDATEFHPRPNTTSDLLMILKAKFPTNYLDST
jgi:hypothetical protein